MLIGMMNDPRRDACAEARWAAASGFDFLDLTIEGPGADRAQIDGAELKRILDGAGMRLVGHTAWYLPFASPFARVREAAVACVAECFELFASLGATKVNVHIVPGVHLFGREAALRWNGECFAELAARAEPYGIQIVVEHPPDPAISTDAVTTVLNHDPRLGFHLDVGHANVGGDRLEKLLERLGSRLAHVHFSDNRGKNDDHMPLGAGAIDWQHAVALLKQHHYDATITLEVFSPDRDYLLLSAKKVREWWGAV